MPVPADIDGALLALGRQSGLSSVLRSLERALDMAVSSAFQRSPPYPADVTKAFDLLRQCLTFAGSSSAGPGDKLELPRLQQLAAMLEALAPPSAPPPPHVAIAREPAARKVGPPVAAAARPARRPPPVTSARVNPERFAGLVGAVLSKLSSLYELRQRLLADPLATWRDFLAVDRQMRNAISAVEWLAGAATEPAQALLAAAEGEADGFAAALDLSCTIEIPPSKVKEWLDGSTLKALVNENLLDFRFTLNGVMDGGQPVQGQSRNRLFLYCKKTVVFLPGLFGSQLQIKMTDGRVLGYPAFYKSGHFEWSKWWVPDTDQYAGILECDENGVPLYSFPNISLLMCHDFSYVPDLSFLPHDVIDPFTACHAARRTILPLVPAKFLLYTLIIYPYDWRTDLTDAAARLNRHLLDLQTKRLKTDPDSDDQVAVMGHSTGGVVIRRALGPISDNDCMDPALKDGNHPAADGLISHAFFLSVPFNGAPKALPVLMTGLAEPEGDKMLPMLTPETLVAISLVMPIVYHLATTSDYGYRPASSPARPSPATPDREGDKAAFVAAALDAGLMPRPWFVSATVTKQADRENLARGADEWHKLVRELWERTSGLSVLSPASASYGVTKWFDNEIDRRGLRYQYDARQVAGGWNATLAARAKDFHQKSITAITGVWKHRSAIFFGIAEAATFRQTNLSKGAVTTHSGGVIGVLREHGGTYSASSLSQANIQTASWHNKAKTVYFTGGIKTFNQWSEDGDQISQTPWTLQWAMQPLGGDGTVPSDSQLAEANNVAKLIPIANYKESPKHMDTTKATHVWESLVLAMHRGFAAVKDGSGDNSAAKQQSAAFDQLGTLPDKDFFFAVDK
jgi:hypothetical protein